MQAPLQQQVYYDYNGYVDLKWLIFTSVASTSCSFEMRNTFLAEEKRQTLKLKYAQSQSVIQGLSCIEYS